MIREHPADRYLIFDESGNLGNRGRYFVISCIDTENFKAIHNIMKRKLFKAKQIFPELATLHAHEIKAKDAYPCVKYHIAECLTRKEMTISYIVADLHHVKPQLLEDKNIFYNYMMKLLLCRLITHQDDGSSIRILYDNHSTKVGSTNSLEEYIRLTLNYDRDIDAKLSFSSMDSDAADAYSVQAADYIANALYSHYEYGVSAYYSVLTKKFNHIDEFPYRTFGN